MRVSILALDGCRAGTVYGVRDVINVANTVAEAQSGNSGTAIETNIVSLDGHRVLAAGGVWLDGAEAAIDATLGPVLFIPGCLDRPESFEDDLLKHGRAARLIAQHHARGQTVLASCSAVFILGLAGLLDYRPTTTSWWAQPSLTRLFPKAQLKPDASLTESDRVICAAGPFSYASALLPIFVRAHGEQVASLVGKYAMIEEFPRPQAAYRSAYVQKRFYPLPYRIEEIVRRLLPDKPCAERVASELGMTTRTLQRRIRQSGHGTVKGLIDQTRIQVASELIAASTMSLGDVAGAVGYSEDSAFRRAFKRVRGVPPSQLRRAR